MPSERRRCHWITTGIVALVGIVPASSAAQVTPRDRAQAGTSAWLSVGVGGGGGHDIEAGLGASAQLTVRHGRHQGRLRVAAMLDIGGFPDSGGGQALADVGLLYGRGLEGSVTSIMAGLAVVGLGECGNRDPAGCATVGIPVVGELMLPGDFVTLGLELAGNLNIKAPYAALSVSLAFGVLP